MPTRIVRKVATDLYICSCLACLHLDGVGFVCVRQDVFPLLGFVHLASTLNVRPAETNVFKLCVMKPISARNLITVRVIYKKAKTSTSDI